MSITPLARPTVTLLPAATPVRTVTPLPTVTLRPVSETVRLYNATGVTLRIAASGHASPRDVLPAIGTTVAPGGTLRLDVPTHPVPNGDRSRRSDAAPSSPATRPRTVVVAVEAAMEAAVEAMEAMEAVPRDDAVGRRRYLLGVTTDASVEAVGAGPVALTVPDSFALRTAGGYVVVEDGRRIRGDRTPDAPVARSRTLGGGSRWRVRAGRWSGP